MPNESWRVPDSKMIPEADPDLRLIPEGVYKCKIVEFRPPRQSTSREFHWVMCLVTEIIEGPFEGRQLYYWINGFPYMIQMIAGQKEHYMSLDLSVRVKHRQYQEHIYAAPNIIWPVSKEFQTAMDKINDF